MQSNHNIDTNKLKYSLYVNTACSVSLKTALKLFTKLNFPLRIFMIDDIALILIYFLNKYSIELFLNSIDGLVVFSCLAYWDDSEILK